MTRYRYDMIGAAMAAENRHPQLVIREWFPDAVNLVPESMFDCWTFEVAEASVDAPIYFVPMKPGA